MEAADRAVVMLFAKFPEPGRSKTRLAPALGEEGAAELSRALLADTAETVRAVPGVRRELWLPPRPAGREELGGRFSDFRLRRQPHGDLGAKLAGAFATVFGEGARRALAVGSDHPTLPPEYLHRGIGLLDEVPIVLGPARDGGYYAVGLAREAWPRADALFRRIPWSGDRVLAVTRERAGMLGLEREELPTWYDVDEPDDLERLRHEAPEGSATASALSRMRPREGDR